MPCLDTSFLIDLLGNPRKNAHQNAVERYRAFLAEGEQLCTTRICQAELYVGFYRGRPEKRERDLVEELLAALVILDIGADGARHFARIKSHLLDIGRPVGDMDVLIAAIAMAHGQTLVTRNVRHFADMPGLVVESY